MRHDYPRELQLHEGQTLTILWSDGHRSTYPGHHLRCQCQCALCVDEWTGQPRLSPERIPSDVRPLQANPVGRYGIQIDWSDGHTTGIYTFERLRQLCPCSTCSTLHPA